ncbi:biliverdin-producing heme oxygenase [Nodularia spumigena]|uniref:biliverdin-producing heme oxygenase n=1 Tax=Nodularia spumigena TaxID=70799 RepID=UPI002B1EE358|nr:biliverdin-producing heme oxygenase [Nodularia spumigena]MEA5557662.1 biliverdin-producing heme oxygenase [Nodularia spumigena CH309]
MSTAATTPIGDRLKDENAELHTRAEKAPLQAALVQGRLSREGYAALLGQMLFVHRAVEEVVEKAAAAHAGIGAIVSQSQHKSRLVEQDLADLGVNAGSITPLASTARVVSMIRERGSAHPEVAFGLHYVLEGANNGNQFIARVIQRTYAFEGGSGTRSLDPYGPRQREVWGAFKQSLNAQEFTDAERDCMVDGAKAMFQAIIDISEELWQAVGKA